MVGSLHLFEYAHLPHVFPLGLLTEAQPLQLQPLLLRMYLTNNEQRICCAFSDLLWRYSVYINLVYPTLSSTLKSPTVEQLGAINMALTVAKEE